MIEISTTMRRGLDEMNKKISYHIISDWHCLNQTFLDPKKRRAQISDNVPLKQKKRSMIVFGISHKNM